ncbi:MAG TPA: hypothetical protein VM713_04190, partial [Steroidobacteraceae bacterium]|nr:hypothetical protein [Steroidobacteraceae bacterium]
MDKTQRHWLTEDSATSGRDAIPDSQSPVRTDARFRETAHVQFNFALLYSDIRNLLGGHFQA